jgi:hypothetical protein
MEKWMECDELYFPGGTLLPEADVDLRDVVHF